MLKGWMGKTVICVAMLAGTLAAQIGGTGTIKGSVADPSGALIPGATVSATHIATGIETKLGSQSFRATGIRPSRPRSLRQAWWASSYWRNQ